MAVLFARTFDLNATSGMRSRDVDANVAAIDKVVTAGIATPCEPRRFCPTPRSLAAAWPPT